MIPVKYVGTRDRYIEGCYGSKIEFVRGETQLVEPVLANKLLRHADCYVRGDDESAKPAKVKPAPSEETEDELQDARDTVQNMDIVALREFAKTNYRREFHPMHKVETIRKGVLQLIDLYGIS